ncbi:UNVERIFIED_CONTAM: hypothetical protein GTU68_059252 [Idotea baltica]|nr:hypothetical protein [Idotea baltica]
MLTLALSANLHFNLHALDVKCLGINVFLSKDNAITIFICIVLSNGHNKVPLRIAHFVGRNGLSRIDLHHLINLYNNYLKTISIQS